MLSRSPRAAALIAISIAFGGCTVGPTYEREATVLNESWLARSDGGIDVSPEAVSTTWWTSFGDSDLDLLIETALDQNLTLEQAGLRVLQARAVRGISAGQFFPQSQSAFGGVDATRVSKNSPSGAGDRSFATDTIGLQAAWELDFWGKFRLGIESSDAALMSTIADFDAVALSLIADVAATYVQLRSFEERLALAQANVQLQSDTLKLTEVRLKAGKVSEFDVSVARALLTDTQSLVPTFQDGIRQSKLALCVLLGRNPSELEDMIQPGRPVPMPPTSIAIGVPADLMRRRPDIRAAERRAAAASAQIGIAEADFYPSISLTGVTGLSASTYDFGSRQSNLVDIADAESFGGFIGLSVNFPILNYGRIENNVRLQDAEFQESLAAYRSVVLNAAKEVEGGLSTFLRSNEQATYLQQSVESQQRAVDISLIQYRNGAIDFLRVNRVQTDLVDRQDQFAFARASKSLGAIAAYRALGGGWEVRAGREVINPDTAEIMRARTDWGDLIGEDYSTGSDVGFKRPAPDDPARSTPTESEQPQ